MTVEAYLPLMASIVGVFLIYLAYLVVRGEDLVYASASLAVLGMFNALLIAMLGYTLVSVFLVIVYVGAAVMFIIITVSMLGGRGGETRDEFKGLFAAGSFAIVALLLVYRLGAHYGFRSPGQVSPSEVASSLLSGHTFVIGLIFLALAATLVEAIAITRRG